MLMIPLQILMIGFKWQLLVVIVVVCVLLAIGWKKIGCFSNTAGMEGCFVVCSVYRCCYGKYLSVIEDVDGSGWGNTY